MTRTLKIGTRQSLLALAQSRIVARDLECLHPGLKTELVGISTRGDETLDIPLSRMEGKDFFVAEIDRALLDGTIDCTVHSLKDLSLERPPGLVTAAIPRRENPRDVVLFAPDIINRLKNRQPLRLGTSSPRRMENVPAFLANALPQYSSTPPQVECRRSMAVVFRTRGSCSGVELWGWGAICLNCPGRCR